MNTLSLAMIVKNEEKNLPRVLSTIHKICFEIIVVDTGSTDKTVEIAKSYGAIVLEQPWENDFAKARNLSIRDAKGDWILWLDGDDYVPEDSIPLIQELVQSEPKCVYAFTVKNERPDGTGTEFLQARMFPNRRGLLFERPVHEQIMLSALRQGLTMVTTLAWVEHHGYADAEEMKHKALRNVGILQSNLDVYGDDPVTFVEIGDSYSIIGDQDLADLWYEKTISLSNGARQFPEVVSQAWMGLGNSANVKENFVEAEHCFRKVIELCPGRIDLYYNYAVTFEKQGLFEDAVMTLCKIFTTSIQKVKVGVDVRQAKIRGGMKMIRLLLKWRNHSLLREKIAFLLHELPDRLEIVNACAAAYYCLEEFGDSVKLFSRSMNERPEGNIDALIGLTLIYLVAGKDECALLQIEDGADQFAVNCRYHVFRTLFSVNLSTLGQFSKLQVETEILYLADMFGLVFDRELLLASSGLIE